MFLKPVIACQPQECPLKGTGFSLTFGFIVYKPVDLGNRTIESNDRKTVICNIHDQVLAHHSQTNEAEIAAGYCSLRATDIDAGETSAVVSQIGRSEKLLEHKGQRCCAAIVP